LKYKLFSLPQKTLIFAKNAYLCVAILKITDMAIPIKRAPVLRGKAAREFHERWEQMLIRESQISDEERARRAESLRETREFLAKQNFM
jgi:hypothetical protein